MYKVALLGYPREESSNPSLGVESRRDMIDKREGDGGEKLLPLL